MYMHVHTYYYHTCTHKTHIMITHTHTHVHACTYILFPYLHPQNTHVHTYAMCPYLHPQNKHVHTCIYMYIRTYCAYTHTHNTHLHMYCSTHDQQYRLLFPTVDLSTLPSTTFNFMLLKSRSCISGCVCTCVYVCVRVCVCVLLHMPIYGHTMSEALVASLGGNSSNLHAQLMSLHY